MALEKSIRFYVYKNDNDNPKAPTHSFNNYVIREDITLKAGTEVDVKFWGNSTNQDGKSYVDGARCTLYELKSQMEKMKKDVEEVTLEEVMNVSPTLAKLL